MHYRMVNWLTKQLIKLNKRSARDLDDSDSSFDPRSRSDRKKRKKRYQHVSELHKNMREALRVNNTFSTFLF